MVKAILTIILVMIFPFHVFADTITFKDGSHIFVDEYEISGDTIKCKIFDSWRSYPFSSIENIESGNQIKRSRKETKKKEKKINNENMVHLIVLNTGKKIIAKEIWEETNAVQYMKYGSLISIERDEINEILWIGKNEANSYKYKQSESHEMTDNQKNDNSAVSQIANESKIRALRKTGYPARFVQIGMTKDDVIALAGMPTKRTTQYKKQRACDEVYDETWEYFYRDKGIVTAVYLRDNNVVCMPATWRLCW